MKRSQLTLFVVGVLLFCLVPLVARSRQASVQATPGEDRLAQIDRTLQGISGQVKDLDFAIRRVTLEQQAREGMVVNIGSADTWRWAMNPADGTVLRINQSTGSVEPVFQSKPGRWTVVYTLASYCWLFSAAGNVVRVDMRDGDTRPVLATRPGTWEVAAGPRPEQIFAVVLNRETGEAVRIDRRNGEAKSILPPR